MALFFFVQIINQLKNLIQNIWITPLLDQWWLSWYHDKEKWLIK